MKLTMKAIIRWEQLNKKPFDLLDYSSEDDVLSLFYVCQPGEPKITFVEFRKGLTDDDVKEMAGEFERQTRIISQFQTASKKNGAAQVEGSTSNPAYIKDIIPMLVMNGLNVYFALNDMDLCDLPIFTKAYEQGVKDRLMSERLWAFMQLSPHLKKGATPKDICPFAWEVEDEALSEKKIEEEKNEFSTFIKSGLKV